MASLVTSPKDSVLDIKSGLIGFLEDCLPEGTEFRLSDSLGAILAQDPLGFQGRALELLQFVTTCYGLDRDKVLRSSRAQLDALKRSTLNQIVSYIHQAREGDYGH